METIEHDGRTTAYRRFGDGDDTTTLCVHGTGGTHEVWAPMCGGPADRLPEPSQALRPAAAVDLSGHGESADVTTPTGTATLAAYADDVVAVAEDVDVLVGNSMGGAAALTVVLDRDLPLEGLVLVGSGAKLGVDESLRELLGTDFEGYVDAMHEPDQLFHDPDPELVEQSRAGMRATGQRITARDMLSCDAFDVRDRLGEVDVPTLAVCGEHDELTPPAFHEYVAENVPDGRFETIPDAAHVAMVERPGAVGRAVGEFCEEVGG